MATQREGVGEPDERRKAANRRARDFMAAANLDGAAIDNVSGLLLVKTAGGTRSVT